MKKKKTPSPPAASGLNLRNNRISSGQRMGKSLFRSSAMALPRSLSFHQSTEKRNTEYYRGLTAGQRATDDAGIRSKGQTLRGCRMMTSNSARKLPICVKGDKK